MELERQKLSEMKVRGKLEYIWTYYKPVIFGIIGVIALIFIIRNQIENAKYYDILSIGVANSTNVESLDPLEEELQQQFGDSEDQYQRVSHFLDEVRQSGLRSACLFAHGGILTCARVYIGEYDLVEAFKQVPSYGEMIEIEI